MAVLIRNAVALLATERAATNLVVLGGVALALACGALIAAGYGIAGIALAMALPAAYVMLRYPWAAVLLWLAAMPFFVVGDETAGPDTWILHRLLIPGVLVVSLIYRMLGLSRSHFRLSITDLAIVMFLILAIANIQLLSNNPVRLSVAFYDGVIVPICMYWLVRVIEPRDAELRRLLIVAVWLIIVQVSVGFLSWMAPSILPDAWLGRAGERTVGTVGGPAPYSVTLIFGVMLVVPYLVRAETRLQRLGLSLLVAAAFIGIIITFSRGSWLGATLVFAGLAVVYRQMASRLLVIVLLLGAAIAMGPMSDQLDLATERLGDAQTADARLVTNNAAMRMIGERPLLGFGYGNFERFDESYKVRIGDIAVQPGGSAHHTYLALAAENGLPALFLYLVPAAWLLVLTLSRWRRLAESSPANRTLLVLLWLAVLHQVAVSSFMDMLHSSAWGTTLWWLTLALIHVIITRASIPPLVRRVAWTVPMPVPA